ncbi:MAG: hypothetical protein AB7F74_22835 [Parvibaculaceae bacterium]
MGIANPLDTVIGILAVIDEVRAKMKGTPLAAFPWRPASPAAADDLAELAHDAMARCDDVTEAVIVVTVAAMRVASREANQRG